MRRTGELRLEGKSGADPAEEPEREKREAIPRELSNSEGRGVLASRTLGLHQWTMLQSGTLHIIVDGALRGDEGGIDLEEDVVEGCAKVDAVNGGVARRLGVVDVLLILSSKTTKTISLKNHPFP
ncbi:hypothetical protein NM208_g3699 [Fusarium decemcellulare]|uniref:Uncharacterized protein n=1 Tax=Fusarium decemcellulare TaxID=57161 RepID=A0ACC1SNK6_9HYPO|nr:hypothetical protein NM208_g3699 [Fusarium decemcellulare]